jgi:hypothetical protein
MPVKRDYAKEGQKCNPLPANIISLCLVSKSDDSSYRGVVMMIDSELGELEIVFPLSGLKAIREAIDVIIAVEPELAKELL